MNCTNKYTYKPPALFVKLLLPVIVVSIYSCSQKKQPRSVERAFYYWKSVLNISGFELKQLDTLQVNTLYIKFFDVDWNAVTQQPAPAAKLQTGHFKLPEKFGVIPTVFITNECIKKITSAQAATLADNIYKLVQDIVTANGFNTIKEIQIDCDWTASTKDTYFLLLEKINALWKNAAIPVSATIRLHQIKFMSKTGVPPVKKGLLMCYNMGNLKNPATNNSILETSELEKYTAQLAAYPLPLDAAFPLFSWKVLFRNNLYSGLIQELPDSVLTNGFITKKTKPFYFFKRHRAGRLYF